MTQARIGAAHSRRRFLSIAAAAGGLALIPGSALRATDGKLAAQVWRGTALGAEASITLYHPDAEAGRALIRRALAEIARLEAVFSLYREDSALARLNRQGALAHPPLDLVRLLSEARAMSELTDGAFDVTVQPLWRLYAAHFETPDADPDGPSEAAVAGALALVDYRGVKVDSNSIRLAQSGMALTLNGIAQGYVTDRVADLLRGEGLDSVLIDLGEIRALGEHPEGRPWRVGLKDPFDAERITRKLELRDRALATSAGAGMRFDPRGRHHHLFDPKSGRSAQRYTSVSVVAEAATRADALSTAFSNMSPERAEAVCRALADVTAYLSFASGEMITVSG